MAIRTVRMGGVLFSPRTRWGGPGYFAGQAPTQVDDTDGRFRILNVPTRGRVSLYERSSMICIATVVTGNDGTWVIDGVDPSLLCTVIGWDGTKQHNAAIQDCVRAAPR